MELKQQLVFCNKCKNKKFDMKQGVLCGLTLRKPSFDNTCKDFDVDPVEEQKIAAKQLEAQRQLNENYSGSSSSGSSVSPWTIIVVILVVVRIIMRLMRD